MNRSFRRGAVTAPLIVGLIFQAGVAFAAEKLVAAYYSDRYHVASCKVAQKIHPDDVTVYKSPEEAVEAGLSPCKKCNPPVPADYKKASRNFELKKKGNNSDDES